MIKTFAHKGLKELFEKGRTPKIDTKQQLRCKMLLDAIHAATSVTQIGQPGFNLHPLHQFKPLRYSVMVNGAWRIIFEFNDGDAYRVDFEQYH